MILRMLIVLAFVLIVVLATWGAVALTVWGAVALTVWMFSGVGVPLTILCLTAALLALATL